MGGDCIAAAGGIVIATRQMNEVIEVDEANRTITVQAGITIEDVNKVLSRYGLWFPHDPESKPTSTVGAAIACDNNGTFGLRYGSMVDLLLSARVALPTGEVIDVGPRKAHTTSTGYKLHYLMLGAQGTLGVVTEATLAVHPRPPSRAVSLWLLPTMQAGIETLFSLQQAGVCIESAHINDRYRLDYYTHAYRERTGRNVAVPDGYQALLGVSVAGDEDMVAWNMGKIGSVVAGRGGMRLDNADIEGAWWASKHTLSWEKNKWSSSQKHAKFGAADVAVPVGRVQDIYDAFIHHATARGLDIVGVAVYNARPHVSPSLSCAVYVIDHDPLSVYAFYRFLDDMARAALSMEGTMSSYIGDGMRLRHLARTEHGGSLDMMWKVKQAFDPRRILNPHKIFPDDIERGGGR
jgi:FAD/FMN-containing dehydrogenase